MLRLAARRLHSGRFMTIQPPPDDDTPPPMPEPDPAPIDTPDDPELRAPGADTGPVGAPRDEPDPSV